MDGAVNMRNSTMLQKSKRFAKKFEKCVVW